jgi:hypothetical protein
LIRACQIVITLSFVFTLLPSLLSLVTAQTLVPGMHGMSIVPGVKFTWIIVSSDNEISMNLRYNGTGSTPPISIVATALSNEGQSSIGGSQVLDAGWISPNSMIVKVNGSSSLYDADLIAVYATPYGTPIPITEAPAITEPTPSTDTPSQSQSTTQTPSYSADTQSGNDNNCHSSYIGVCIPPPPAEVNCSDIPETDFTVRGPDVQDLDSDGDGLGCESAQ